MQFKTIRFKKTKVKKLPEVSENAAVNTTHNTIIFIICISYTIGKCQMQHFPFYLHFYRNQGRQNHGAA